MYRVKDFNQEKINKYYDNLIKIEFDLISNGKVRGVFADNDSNSIFEKDKKQVTLLEAFDKLKDINKDYFNDIFNGIELKSILTNKFEYLKCITNRVNNLVNKEPFLKTSAFLFDYKKYRENNIVSIFQDDINPRVCYYCNIDFINVYDEENKKDKFTLDHFLDKATYPYLALSLYNLVPCCYTCNSKIKKKEKFSPNTNPHNKDFDFDERVKFKLFFSKDNKELSNDKIFVKLKEECGSKYKDYIEKFYLNERYNAHIDIVIDMIKKAELYPESRLKELQALTGLPYQQIRKDIFNLLGDDDIKENIQFSKLINDMAKELGIIK